MSSIQVTSETSFFAALLAAFLAALLAAVLAALPAAHVWATVVLQHATASTPNSSRPLSNTSNLIHS